MKSISALLLLLSTITLSAQTTSGTIITKSITISNGDTIVQEQEMELDSDGYGTIDTFLPGNLDFDLDSIFNKSLGDVQMFFGNIDSDSIFRELDIRIHQFSDGIDLDSIFQNVPRDGMSFSWPDFKSDSPTDKDLRSKYTVSDKIEEALNRDGLLVPNQMNTVELSGKTLKINGDKQPDNLYNKYKSIWQSQTGLEMAKKDKITMQLKGQAYHRSMRGD